MSEKLCECPCHGDVYRCDECCAGSATPKSDAGLVEAVNVAIERLSIDIDQRLTLERTMEIREALIEALASIQGKEGGGE